MHSKEHRLHLGRPTRGPARPGCPPAGPPAGALRTMHAGSGRHPRTRPAQQASTLSMLSMACAGPLLPHSQHNAGIARWDRQAFMRASCAAAAHAERGLQSCCSFTSSWPKLAPQMRHQTSCVAKHLAVCAARAACRGSGWQSELSAACCQQLGHAACWSQRSWCRLCPGLQRTEATGVAHIDVDAGRGELLEGSAQRSVARRAVLCAAQRAQQDGGACGCDPCAALGCACRVGPCRRAHCSALGRGYEGQPPVVQRQHSSRRVQCNDTCCHAGPWLNRRHTGAPHAAGMHTTCPVSRVVCWGVQLARPHSAQRSCRRLHPRTGSCSRRSTTPRPGLRTLLLELLSEVFSRPSAPRGPTLAKSHVSSPARISSDMMAARTALLRLPMSGVAGGGTAQDAPQTSAHAYTASGDDQHAQHGLRILGAPAGSAAAQPHPQQRAGQHSPQGHCRGSAGQCRPRGSARNVRTVVPPEVHRAQVVQRRVRPRVACTGMALGGCVETRAAPGSRVACTLQLAMQQSSVMGMRARLFQAAVCGAGQRCRGDGP